MIDALFAVLGGLATAPAFPPALALGAALLVFALDRQGRLDVYEWGTTLVLVPVAAALVQAPAAAPMWSILAPGLVVALLARDRESLLQSECALKLAWVMGAALALSWTGVRLLELATGTDRVVEQWAVLDLAVDPDSLWRTALPLALLLGVVLVGGAPFHFWAADILHGAPAWLAPLAVIVIQISGARWLTSRLAGIASFEDGAKAVAELLSMAAFLALAVGAVTLMVQRRPERRVGTLASLQGGLLLGALAFARGGASAGVDPQFVARWTAHLVLALSGAAILSRFLPAAGAAPGAAAVLFRRHPASALAGLFALFSLAGVPGTPGAGIWLDAAANVTRGGWLLVTLALGAAWLAALTVAVRQMREAFGLAVDRPPPAQAVPWQARAALWTCAIGLVVLEFR